MPGMPKPLATARDEDLMLAYAQTGDMAAFEALYARQSLPMWRFVLRSVGDPSLADDIAQDVWFNVVRSAASYVPKAKFKTWLFTLAHNRMVDHWRTQRAHLPLDAGTDERGLADTLAADSGWGPMRQLQSREQGAALIEAIEQLPAEQREVFLLQAEAGMSVEEIAQATGVGFETAKSRLRYARHSLRQSLKEFA
jgi:RNA polymerase sigma-70 factor (ECF subfamily)